MILHFKEHTHIYTDKQHFDIKQASMIVQEKEPLSPQRGFKMTAKWSSRKPSKQEEIVVGHGLTTIFLCIQSIDLTAYPQGLIVINRSNSATETATQIGA